MSLDAKVITDGIYGKKSISINNFFVGYRKTRLRKGEFIYSIKIPILKNNIFKAFKISKRNDDDISSVCCSFNLELNSKWIELIKIRDICNMSIEEKRASKEIG